jgi:hypothetical protein
MEATGAHGCFVLWLEKHERTHASRSRPHELLTAPCRKGGLRNPPPPCPSPSSRSPSRSCFFSTTPLASRRDSLTCPPFSHSFRFSRSPLSPTPPTDLRGLPHAQPSQLEKRGTELAGPLSRVLCPRREWRSRPWDAAARGVMCGSEHGCDRVCA